jgi:hypothetical protein
LYLKQKRTNLMVKRGVVMALGILIGFVVGAAVVMYFMAAPLMRLSEDERNDIVRKIQAAGWRNKR